MLKKSDISISISNGDWKMDNQLKTLENPMIRGYLVSLAHKNIIKTAMPM